jgi:hypothetical protein
LRSERDGLLYLDLAEFVHYLVYAYENGQLLEIEAGFNLLERLIAEGDSQTEEYAALGIIETLQNFASHSCGARIAASIPVTTNAACFECGEGLLRFCLRLRLLPNAMAHPGIIPTD